MVCADDYGSPPQMLPVLLQTIHHIEEFLVCDAISPLCMRYGMTGIHDDAQLTILFLLMHGSQSNVGCISVQDKGTFIARCN